MIVGSGFSWPSTVPCCNARYTSAKAIGVALAPTDFVNIRNNGAGGTRSFMPFMSSGFLISLLAGACRLPQLKNGTDLWFVFFFLPLLRCPEKFFLRVGLPVCKTRKDEEARGDASGVW